MDALASHIVHVCHFVRLMLSSGVFGSVEGPAFEEGQAGELVTSFKSLGTLDSGQSQCTPVSKFTAK